MPKVKNKKIVGKRFRITKNGKVLHRVQGKRHIRRKKSKSRQRRQDQSQTMTNTRFMRMVKRYMSR